MSITGGCLPSVFCGKVETDVAESTREMSEARKNWVRIGGTLPLLWRFRQDSCWKRSVVAVTMRQTQAPPWLTGNKLRHEYGARRGAGILQASFAICFRKRATRW